jgi:hypothetical protein
MRKRVEEKRGKGLLLYPFLEVKYSVAEPRFAYIDPIRRACTSFPFEEIPVVPSCMWDRTSPKEDQSLTVFVGRLFLRGKGSRKKKDGAHSA